MSGPANNIIAAPHWNRRQFGQVTGATLLATMTGCAAGEEAEPKAPFAEKLTTLGIQLFTVRESFETDALGTLQAVADTGFSEVEFGGGGYFEKDPVELRAFLDQTGLAAPGMHCMPDQLTDQMDRVISIANTVGVQHVVLPWVSEEMRGSVDAWKGVADLCSDAAARLADEGIAFAYHNHDFEFDAVDGELTGLDILAAQSDPEMVKFELDFYWAVAAGQDVDALIDKHAGRITLCHIKDVAEDGLMTLPGEGSINFAAILKQSQKAGLEHFFVESDRLKTVDKARLKAASDHLVGMEIS